MKTTIEDLHSILNEIQEAGGYKRASLYLRLFADGSGSLRGKGDESLISFGNLEIAKTKLKAFLAEQKLVKIPVGSYMAEISDRGIKVGCTQVSFETLDAIVEATKKVRPTDTLVKSRIGQRVPFNKVKVGEQIKFDNMDTVYTRVKCDGNSAKTLTFENSNGTVTNAYCSADDTDLVTIVG